MDNCVKKGRAFREGPFEYHQEIELKIEDLTNLGLGLGRSGGVVVMVAFALPGELVRARIFRNHKNYSEADLLEVLEPSPDRVQPVCPLFGKCGGCQYQHLSYPAQLAWKRKQIGDLVERIGGLSGIEIEPAQGSPMTFGYRSKLTPHYERPRGGEMPIGFVMQGTRNKIIDVERCPIASDAINETLPAVRESLRARMPSLRRGGTALLRDTLEGVVTDNRAVASEKVGALTLQFVAGEFFQNNPHALPGLLEYAAAEAEGPENLVDAYCGVGGFALWAAPRFKRVMGVEISANSISCARANAKINGIENCEFIAGKAEAIFSEIPFSGTDAAMIIDPPRSGCDGEFLRQLVEFAPRKLVYVSCGPDTQARDLNYLANNGYKVARIRPFDLFPQTRHIESVATLERA